MFEEGYKKEQVWQIAHACDLGLRYVCNDYNKIAKNSDWLNFTDAANHLKDFVPEWTWINTIREAASELLHITPGRRVAFANRFVLLCWKLLAENLEVL